MNKYRGTLILFEHSIVPVFQWAILTPINDEEREILKTLNIHPVKAEKDDTDLALGVEQAIQKGIYRNRYLRSNGWKIRSFYGNITNSFQVRL